MPGSRISAHSGEMACLASGTKTRWYIQAPDYVVTAFTNGPKRIEEPKGDHSKDRRFCWPRLLTDKGIEHDMIDDGPVALNLLKSSENGRSRFRSRAKPVAFPGVILRCTCS